ncbi:MAG: YcaO-related McrA-glycine thioamidation protein [Thermoplasmatales archaeon]|nr:YcaO-related McrA-glycine thioamidation protein [Thermoplasmatales archaeon]
MRLVRRPKLRRGEGIRSVDPSETLARFEPLLGAAGMGPLEDLTGMDSTGIPVYAVHRDETAKGTWGNYNGKGHTPEQAMASAVMEAMERYSSEVRETDEIIYGTVAEAEAHGPTVRPGSLILPVATAHLADVAELAWARGYDIIRGEEVWVPACAIFHPYYPDGDLQLFRYNTNGLASGNDLEEAILHALFEVVERDAWSIAEYRGVPAPDVTVAEGTPAHDLVGRFADAGVEIRLKDITSDVGIPTIAAASDDVRTRDPEMLAIGVGTHLDPQIAAVRALTEVAQSRSTHKHGVKVNARLRDATRELGYDRVKGLNRVWYGDGPRTVPLAGIEDRSTDYVMDDLEIALGALVGAGLTRAAVVDLTREDVGVPTVRVVVPGMEVYAMDSERMGNRLYLQPDSDITY